MTTPDPDLDARLLAILDARAEPGELASALFDRKEDALWEIFSTLPPMTAFELHRRLALASPDDELSNHFQRMIVERRGRLLEFLGDPRRRAALEAQRR